MNIMRAALATALAATLAGEAAATVSLQFTKLNFNAADAGNGDVVRLGYNVVSDGAGTARQFTNIGGQLTLRLISVTTNNINSNSAWRFYSTITNTSTAPMTSARISAVGFSTAAAGATGNNPAFPHISSAAIVGTPSIYDVVATSNSGLNVPNVAGSNNVQVCLKASGNLNNCTGGGGDGLELGTPNPFPWTATEFVLNFTAPSARTAITLHNFVLRFQSLTGTGLSESGNGNLNGASGVGVVTKVDNFNNPVVPVPEPSSWAMLIAGFGLIGATLRRRRARFAAQA